MILSIIIPTYNEEEYLPVLLESIKKQNFDSYEIIVADANSTDKTVEIAEEYGCRIVEGGMPAVGRNNGAKVANGEYLLFLDSDLKLTDDYLRDLVYEFRMERLGIGITQMEPLSKKAEDIILHELANRFMITVENIKPHGAGCYGIIAKKYLHDQCNGFDETLNFGEDTDYIERLAKKERFKVLRKPKVGVSTRRLEEEGLNTLLRQYGKSTLNDFMGKRTDAEELNYSFGHKNNEINKNNNFNTVFKNFKKLDFNIKTPRKNSLNEININSRRIKKNIDRLKKQPLLLNEKNKSLKQKDKKLVFYTVCGEGMGHAIRSSVILDEIKDDYDIHIFSSHRAFSYLNEKFDNVHEIGGFNTVYENNKVSNKKTLYQAMKKNPKNLKNGYTNLYKLAYEMKPDVIVSDFEIYGSMVSKLLQIPLIGLDNIHMITQTKIDYPPRHQRAMLKAKTIIKGYVIKPKIHILTSFFYPKIKPKKRAVLYPPVLRKSILELEPTKEDHILVYQTSDKSLELIEELKSIDENFIVYGFNRSKEDENLTFRQFNEVQFYDDIASAKSVIANGGFTLISEAIHLKKPIYSIPANGNFEQILNGFYVEKLGYGKYNETMNVNHIKSFLNNLETYQEKLDKIKKTDNKGIIKELKYRIEKYSGK